MLMINQLNGFGVDAPKVPSIAFAGSAVNVNNLTTYTFSGAALGDAAADRTLVILAVGRTAANQTVASVTVGGSSATVITQPAASIQPASLWYIDYPAGTTADIVVTYSGAGNNCGIGVWALYGLNSAVPVDSQSTINDTTAMLLDVPANGIAIAGSVILQSASTSTPSNLTEQFDLAIEAANNTYFTGGFYQSQTDAEANRSVSFDWDPGTSTNVSNVGASFR